MANNEPRTIRYETSGMAEIRDRLHAAGFSHDEIDIFKSALTQLESVGFRLQGPDEE